MNTFFIRISGIFTDISYILSPAYKLPKRGQLLRDYLRMRVKVTLGRFFKYKTERFLGYTVTFANYSLFFEIFRQVFVRQAYYVNLAKQKPEIIDCGGNMGMSTLYFKYLYPEATVKVFEPSPTILDILKENISRNNLSDIEILPYAVSNKEGELTMYDKGVGSCGSTLVKEVFESEEHTVEEVKQKASVVKVKKLSDFIQGKVDMLKMDIEGVELDVLSELNESKALSNVSNVSLEYHWYKDNPHNSLKEVLAVFDTSGHRYQVFLEEIVPGADLAMENNGIYYCMIKAQK